MTRSCDNCRRPVLDTDTVCWHCGWKLTTSAPIQERQAESSNEEVQKPDGETTPPILVIFYGTLTLIIAIALLWLMNTLSQSPTIIRTGPPSTEWVTLQDPGKQFAINIPAVWQWEFRPGDLAGVPPDNRVTKEAWLTPAVAPLGELIPDREILLWAGTDSILLVVAGSERLSRLTADQAVKSLSQESFEGIIVESARQIQNSSGENRAIFAIEHENPALICRQLLAPGAKIAYLVAACTRSNSAVQYIPEFEFAIESFRTYD